MAKYKIQFRKSVRKEFEKIAKIDQARILKKLQVLSTDPRPSGCKKLSGQDRYRIRQGNYRILYELQDDVLIVMIVKIGNCRDVYD